MMMDRSTLARWTADIRFWVAIAFVVRLFGITNPPLETSHHWRQTSVLMVARNFVEQGVDLLHPRMDTAGELSGITGMEFPLLNLLVAWGTMLFGDANCTGRLIVLVAGSLGTLFFHALLKRHLGERVALCASHILLVSLWFMYSRKVMPDVFALSLVIAGMERLDAAIRERGRWLPLFLGTLLIMAGLLAKVTAGFLLAAWPILVWDRRGTIAPWIASAAILLATIPALWWYLRWVPHLVETYGYWHFFMGKPLAQGAAELIAKWPRVLDNFYFDALRFSGCAAFLMGLAIAVKKRLVGLLCAFVSLSVAFLVVMMLAGDTFWIHAYYVLPFIPVMAVFAGLAVAAVNDRLWRAGIITLIAVEGLLAQANDFTLSPRLTPLLALEQDLGADHGLIATNTGQDPTAMYFAHRRGWTLSNAALNDPATLLHLEQLGCTRIVIFKELFEQDIALPWPVLLETQTYRIHAPTLGK